MRELTAKFRRKKHVHISYIANCPACKGSRMVSRHNKKIWRCIDCGYKISNYKLRHGVLWFCDGCDAYLNIQHGFNTKGKTWICSKCGYLNDVSRNNII